jgi:hypothetical protein
MPIYTQRLDPSTSVNEATARFRADVEPPSSRSSSGKRTRADLFEVHPLLC